MSDEPQKKPDPIEDVRKGLGLLFRAATTAVASVPTEKFEAAVVSGVKEVGRAIENVASAIDKEVFKNGQKPVGSRTNDTPKSEAKSEPKSDEKVWATQQPPGDVPSPEVPEKPDVPEPPASPPGEPTTKSDDTKPA